MRKVSCQRWGSAIVGIIIGIVGERVMAQDTPEREWTVMVYMNAKNNLESFALDNFHSIAQVGGTTKVSVVAQLGRPQCDRVLKKDCYTTEDGNWSGVYRFLVAKGTAPRPEQALINVATSGESTDMGSPLALTQFIQWAKKSHPAKHYMLVIWNHGQGWRFQLAASRAIRSQTARASTSKKLAESVPETTPAAGGFRAVSSDDDTGSILFNSEVEKVISKEFTSSKLDLLGYDACLMAMIETAYGLASSVDVMVGSQELEPGSGWRYSTWLDKLVANPAMNAVDLSKAVVDSYRQEYRDEYLTTLSAIRLSNIPKAAKSLSEFSDSLRSSKDDEIRAMREARASVQAYGASTLPPMRTSIDITTLLKAYEARSKNSDMRAKSASVREDLASAVISNYASSRSQHPTGDLPYGSEGLAIYYPESADVFYKDYFYKGYLKNNKDRPVAFVQKEQWADLLYKLLEL